MIVKWIFAVNTMLLTNFSDELKVAVSVTDEIERKLRIVDLPNFRENLECATKRPLGVFHRDMEAEVVNGGEEDFEFLGQDDLQSMN